MLLWRQEDLERKPSSLPTPVRRPPRRWSQAFDSVACERKHKFRLDIRKNFFMMRAVKHWKRLLREVMQSPSLAVFKIRLNKALSSLVWSHSWCCFEQEVGLKTCWGPFQPEFFPEAKRQPLKNAGNFLKKCMFYILRLLCTEWAIFSVDM